MDKRTTHGETAALAMKALAEVLDGADMARARMMAEEMLRLIGRDKNATIILALGLSMASVIATFPQASGRRLGSDAMALFVRIAIENSIKDDFGKAPASTQPQEAHLQ